MHSFFYAAAVLVLLGAGLANVVNAPVAFRMVSSIHEMIAGGHAGRTCSADLV